MSVRKRARIADVDAESMLEADRIQPRAKIVEAADVVLTEIRKSNNHKEVICLDDTEEGANAKNVSETNPPCFKVDAGAASKIGNYHASKSITSKPSNHDTKGIYLSYLPSTLVSKLFPHQKAGVNFIVSRLLHPLPHHRGCLVTDVMGLGKSLQLLAGLVSFVTYTKTLNPKHDPGHNGTTSVNNRTPTILLLCPSSVVVSWRHECDKWLPGVNAFTIACLQSSTLNRIQQIRDWQDQGGLLVMSYELWKMLILDNFQRRTLNNDSRAFRSSTMNQTEIRKIILDAGVYILDEGHRIKSADTELSRALAQVKTTRRILLTGTPIQINLMEYYEMANWVAPGILGSTQCFYTTFQLPITAGQCEEALDEEIYLAKRRIFLLRHLLHDIMIRRPGHILEKSLPPMHEFVIFCSLTPLQRKLYDEHRKFIKLYRTTYSLLASFHDSLRVVLHPALLYEKVKQMQCNPNPNSVIDRFGWCAEILNAHYNHNRDGEKMELSSKMLLLINLLDEFRQRGDRTVVFSQSIEALSWIENKLRHLSTHNPWKIFRLQGDTTQDERSETILHFNDVGRSSADVFLVSTRAGGEGITLTGANRIILLDVHFNPSLDNQAVRRCYRYGQTKPVYIYRFVMYNTMEYVVFRRQVVRFNLSSRVLDRVNSKATISRQEMSNIYTEEIGQSFTDQHSPGATDLDHISGIDLNQLKATDRVLYKVCKRILQDASSAPFQDKLGRCIFGCRKYDYLLKLAEDEELELPEQTIALQEYSDLVQTSDLTESYPQGSKSTIELDSQTAPQASQPKPYHGDGLYSKEEDFAQLRQYISIDDDTEDLEFELNSSSSIVICLIPKGLTSVRLQILQQRIYEKGILLVKNPWSKIDGHACTHVVSTLPVDQLVDYLRNLYLLDHDKENLPANSRLSTPISLIPPDAICVTLQWLIDIFSSLTEPQMHLDPVTSPFTSTSIGTGNTRIDSNSSRIATLAMRIDPNYLVASRPKLRALLRRAERT